THLIRGQKNPKIPQNVPPTLSYVPPALANSCLIYQIIAVSKIRELRAIRSAPVHPGKASHIAGNKTVRSRQYDSPPEPVPVMLNVK
ncbi:MAG: hypothetical protein KDE62_13480, partial [Calditrichaeota bacterium]|nr:hypothetical protein [Calditrichota bacterium]MCB0294919.1 hypothetical protein [Calditrichota bacterium]